jgi:hypothetical protein
MQNPLSYVAVRLVLYALSLIPVSVLAGLAGWGVEIHEGAIIIQIETLIGAIFGGLALTGGIFARFGTR